MVNTKKVDGQLVCSFPERMDTPACETHGPKLEEEIAQAVEIVTFDLKGVVYVASSFLRICFRTAKTVGPKRFKLSNVGTEVAKTFEIAGIDPGFWGF